MAGLEDLYREIILDHYRNPRHRGELECPPARRSEGFNPLCGDEIVLTFETDGDTVSDLRVSGQGCSISQASASMMSAAVIGKSTAEIRDLTRAFKAMMSIHEESIGGDGSESLGGAGEHANGDPAGEQPRLGDLEALRGVVKFPVRIKCATLGWNALVSGLDELAASGLAESGLAESP
ncbi:Fe-S cluster assembly sulfur transfer protein SufU [Candidatus Poriferisodalis sp.]|uniref:Fe-S cluster assembly sulfur transfer protein SufU n=1 Tax=Candidatus Poriferisodalis sp. TaxID=3101277 RepID=UPI003B02CF48